ncbi:MAG: PAS domain-containing protein [Eubacteriales bacterium]|nr:PAS domain-containing protein [Eubacteriales bacterium]
MIFSRRNRIGRSSIKESFDNLPDGVCFADVNGMIVLCNRQMYRLCHELTGMDLQHISELENALAEPSRGVQKAERAPDILIFPGGKAWKFSESTISDADGNVYTQMRASDVTVLYSKERELERENRRLEEANARAAELFADLDDIVREEENFAVKTRLHDEMGGLLAFTRSLALQENADSARIMDAVKYWERLIAMFRSAYGGTHENPDSVRDFSALVKAAAGIGVAVHLDGRYPDHDNVCILLNAAVRECAVNTVRHAGGSDMFVAISHECGLYEISITNNGKKPDCEITEGGGLGSLRRRIESAGGTMMVKSMPEFRLLITIPGKERTL